MTESQELFEPSQINEDELIEQLLNEGNVASMQNDEDLQEENPSDKLVSSRNTGFPLARIKALMKMDPDVGLTSSESVFIISKATELFLKKLARETYNYTAKSKRKTIQKRDVDAVIENIDALCFLEGAMD